MIYCICYAANQKLIYPFIFDKKVVIFSIRPPNVEIVRPSLIYFKIDKQSFVKSKPYHSDLLIPLNYKSILHGQTDKLVGIEG